ncbi:MAG: biopolymer transporter ExbD [Myxococcota bacterium]|nr:biopolymer transporter ExbD [Myxococcota bacterium]
MSDHKPSERRRARKQKDPELNLMPFMNLMTLLIPFLLASIQFVALAVIDSSLPAIGQPQPSDDKDKDETPPLNLTIGITDEGFTVAGSAKVLGCDKSPGGDKKCTTVPLKNDVAYCNETFCRGDSNCVPPPSCHDFRELKKLVINVKKADGDGDGMPDYVKDCNAEPAPEVCNVILAPNPDIPYGVLVGVMDATRSCRASSDAQLTDNEARTLCDDQLKAVADAGSAPPADEEGGAAEDSGERHLFPYVVIAGGVK